MEFSQITPLFGKLFKSQEIQDFLSQLSGESIYKSTSGKNLYYRYKDLGVSFLFENASAYPHLKALADFQKRGSRVLTAVFIYNQDTDGCQKFQTNLPNEVNAGDTISVIKQKWGEPFDQYSYGLDFVVEQKYQVLITPKKDTEFVDYFTFTFLEFSHLKNK